MLEVVVLGVVVLEVVVLEVVVLVVSVLEVGALEEVVPSTFYSKVSPRGGGRRGRGRRRRNAGVQHLDRPSTERGWRRKKFRNDSEIPKRSFGQILGSEKNVRKES